MRTPKRNHFLQRILGSLQSFLVLRSASVVGPVLVQLGAMVRPGAVTRRSPLAWAVAEPLAEKNEDFFGCFLGQGCLKWDKHFGDQSNNLQEGVRVELVFDQLLSFCWEKSKVLRFSPGIQVDGSHEWRNLCSVHSRWFFTRVMVVIPRVSLVLYYPRNL